MPLASIQAAHEGIVLTGRYPDYRAEQLCRAIAKAQNIPADRIIPGNGAAELLYALGQTIPGKALAIAPTFTGYAEAVAAGGGEMCYAGCEDADGDVDDMSGQDRLQFDSETVIQRLLANWMIRSVSYSYAIRIIQPEHCLRGNRSCECLRRRKQCRRMSVWMNVSCHF